MSELPDLHQAREARDAAVTAVEQSSSEEVRERLLAVIRLVCLEHPTFIADDVWNVYYRYYPQGAPHEPRVLGPVLIEARKRGWCALAGCLECGTTKVMLPGRRARGHATDMPLYLSLIRR